MFIYSCCMDAVLWRESIFSGKHINQCLQHMNNMGLCRYVNQADIIPQNNTDLAKAIINIHMESWFMWITKREMMSLHFKNCYWYTTQCICRNMLKLTRTTRTPAFWGYPPPPHDYPYHWVILDPKSKEDKVKVTNLKKSPKFQFWNGHYTRHTFWSCLIRCANMKWIRWVFLKIQSGHDSVHRQTDGRTDRRTDGQTDKVIPVYPPINFVEAGGITRPTLDADKPSATLAP